MRNQASFKMEEISDSGLEWSPITTSQARSEVTDLPTSNPKQKTRERETSGKSNRASDCDDCEENDPNYDPGNENSMEDDINDNVIMECGCYSPCNMFFCEGYWKRQSRQRICYLNFETIQRGLGNNLRRFHAQLVKNLDLRVNTRIQEWNQNEAKCLRTSIHRLQYIPIVTKIEIAIDHYITRWSRKHSNREDKILSLKGGHEENVFNELSDADWEKTHCPVYLVKEEDIFYAFAICDELWKRLPTVTNILGNFASFNCDNTKNVAWIEAAIKEMRADTIIWCYYPCLIIEALSTGDCYYRTEELRLEAEEVYKDRNFTGRETVSLRSYLNRYDRR